MSNFGGEIQRLGFDTQIAAGAPGEVRKLTIRGMPSSNFILETKIDPTCITESAEDATAFLRQKCMKQFGCQKCSAVVTADLVEIDAIEEPVAEAVCFEPGCKPEDTTMAMKMVGIYQGMLIVGAKANFLSKKLNKKKEAVKQLRQATDPA